MSDRKHNTTHVKLSFYIAENLRHPASNVMSKVDTWSLF